MPVFKLLNYPKLFCVLVLLLSAQYIYADHLKGGWMQYSYLGESGDNLQYMVSFYQYSDCSEPEKVDGGIYLAIHDAGNNAEVVPVYFVQLTRLNTESKSDFGPCFQNPPTVCYLVAIYTTTITVPKNSSGYVLTVQRCCRIAGITNVPNSNSTGLTYTLTIPGGANSNNNSPAFDFNETVAVCYGSPFSFDFSATDEEGDSLSYSLCSGLTGGSQSFPVVENPTAPPYQSIPYRFPYSGAQPMGPNATIDPQTGIFSGIAPSELGTFVVAVCVNEYRNGVFISKTRKELHINVSNCKLGGASLDPSYISCNGYDFTFVNKAGNNPSYQYFWDFGVTTMNTDTSTLSQPTFTFPDTGTYNVTLKAQNNLGCQDSAKAQVKIFPGFNTDFSVKGSCITNPYIFTDLTTTKYGYVNSWKWFFGDDNLMDDTVQNTTYIYKDTGMKTITLITTNSKGCIDTSKNIIHVTNGPDLQLNFSDTLICNIDTLKIESFSSTPGAVFSWSPSYNILGANTNSPIVFPKQKTTYSVSVSNDGCFTNDSVTVDVTDKVLLSLPADTTICKTDSLQLMPVTNALYFSWTPPGTLSDSAVQMPIAKPLVNTTYNLLASVGKCFATGAIKVGVVPYPQANAGLDASICFGKTALLNASITGSSFSWFPANSLVNPNSLSPVAGPQETTLYILNVNDTLGCPKPATDSVLVTVIPRVNAFAGNDTVVVKSQPLQLNASGGTFYHWSPAFNLSNPDIANPVATFSEGPDTMIYSVKVSTPEGCSANDSIKIYIFQTQPQIFIPTAFTPNGDGRNDVFKPTVAGMKQFFYFRVFNRWGQLLFSTNQLNSGWDGSVHGEKQGSGTYIYDVKAIDYTDKPYFKKGTFVLIR